MWTVIKNRTQYNEAMERITALAEMDLTQGTPEFAEFELLSLLIKHYESEKYPTVKTDPVRAIKFVMEQNQLTPKDMTLYLGSLSRVSEILNYKRKLTLDMIRKLNQGLHIPLDLLVDDYSIEKSPALKSTLDMPLTSALA
ncbi:MULTISPECIES: helix-turn-helix domain-containing protein [unclassified Lonepinella]|uniref:helix-turn-helix domain-containing protein n=1 Tax=unclassified Lonepinella TaxID=2642006 RepID=UPI0036D864FA